MRSAETFRLVLVSLRRCVQGEGIRWGSSKVTSKEQGGNLGTRETASPRVRLS